MDDNALSPTMRLYSTPKHWSYLRIADGCDNRCTYCAIPLIRKNHRSREIEDILIEANEIANRGSKEIVLISQDTTRFGINGIPKDLLFSNKDTRMRLLNNLFSYYGVVVDGKVELNFNAIHGKKLSDDVAFLLRSLGIVDIFYEIFLKKALKSEPILRNVPEFPTENLKTPNPI